jgi:hypothetical protein
VDFDNFRVEEPRARGVERAIPLGRTIALASGADGSVLAVDASMPVLVNTATDASGRVPDAARFKVIDLGLGRVALRTRDGRYVSVDHDQAMLKDIGHARPGTAESFQWVNLLRGDTLLMSLVNHRYLATRPGIPGAVTASAPGASPARKSGAEFRWTALE